MAASPKDKFEAAVKVIRGLPKNGSFQPSHELMLKFYSYFKQATEGPCISPRPAFWDLINKKKWEAWTNLGDMRSEEAMLSYVDELKKVSIRVREIYYPPQIVETMPQTDAVTDFLQKLDNFYEMVEDSENQNTLKMVDKPRLNGSVCTNGTADIGDEGDLSSSYRLTQLLKCDVKWWKDSPDTHRGENNTTNGHSTRFERTENGGSYGHAESEDEDEENIELNPEKVELNKVERMNGRHELNTNIVQNEEYGQVDESRLSLSHSNSSDESETESEEFCDTSDDPIELSMPTSSHNFVSCLPPLVENTSTSTPSGKSVRFDPRTNFPDQDSADSLLVNASQEVADTSDLTDCVVPQEGTLPLETFSDDGQRSDLDILMCRGGEEQDSERRRRGGGQGSREGSSSASRGGHSGSAGGGNSGAEGHRNLYPGPGGGGGWRGPGAGGSVGPTDLNEQIMVTLLRLQHDMSGVLNRLNSLEALVKEQRTRKDKEIKTRGWWPFPDLSVQSTVVIFVWPLLVHCIIAYIRRRHRKLNR